MKVQSLCNKKTPILRINKLGVSFVVPLGLEPRTY